jgi:hypothetical protein
MKDSSGTEEKRRTRIFLPDSPFARQQQRLGPRDQTGELIIENLMLQNPGDGDISPALYCWRKHLWTGHIFKISTGSFSNIRRLPESTSDTRRRPNVTLLPSIFVLLVCCT